MRMSGIVGSILDDRYHIIRSVTTKGQAGLI
jgi:hypothetical protein